MNTTRRDAIRSILAAAAVSAVPAVAEAAIAAKPPTKVERIYAKIKELISLCEKERGLPFDPQWDSIMISLPVSFTLSNLIAMSKCFQMEYPTWGRGRFKFFKFAHCLEVEISRVVVDADEGSALYEIAPRYCSFATMFLDNGQIVAGKF